MLFGRGGSGGGLPPAALEVTRRYKKQYEPQQLASLWRALREIYTSEELALQAVQENPQILNPSYTKAERAKTSRACLVELMGEEDALDVMLKNPALLQCGAALANAQPDEIRGFATVRYLGNRLLPEAARLPTLGAVFAALSYGVAFSNAPGGASDSAEAALALIKPVLGVLFGSLFAASLYGVATASRAKKLL